MGLEEGEALLDLQEDLSESVREAVNRLPTLSPSRRRECARSGATGDPPCHQGAPGQETDDPDPSDAAELRSGGDGMIGRLNHVAIAVPDLEAATTLYRDTLGTAVSKPVDQPEHGVTTVFVELPNTKIELLSALGAASPIARFLGAQPGRRHSPYLLRGRRHPGRPATGWPPTAIGCWATASRGSAPMASRCCSCIRRIFSAPWWNWNRSDAMGWITAVFVYFVTWFLMLFVVLPWGARRPDNPEPRSTPTAPRTSPGWRSNSPSPRCWRRWSGW